MGTVGLSGASAPAVSGASFGIYAENVVNLNISGCHIARNNNNLGLDGYCLCNFTGNNFLTDSGRTGVQIAEYGETNTAYGRNAQNIICNNVFDGALTSPFKKIYFFSTFNSLVNVISNNIGTTDSHILNMNTSGNYEIGQHDHYTINVNNNSYTPPALPSTQVSVITILSHMIGTKVNISFYNSNLSKVTIIKVKTTSATPPQIASIYSSYISYSVANKEFSISGIQQINMIPYVSDGAGWVVNVSA
jgi:hypothetical protein